MNDNRAAMHTPILWHDGSLIDLHDPDLSRVTVEQIATVLGRIPRWGARGPRIVSVLRHSLAVHALADSACASPEVRRAALMHDATEAFVGDMVSTIKHQCPVYEQCEARVCEALERRFPMLAWADAVTHAEVKVFDLAAREIEGRHIFHGEPLGSAYWKPACGQVQRFVELASWYGVR